MRRGDRVRIADTHPAPEWRGQTGELVNVPGDVLNPSISDEPTSRYSMTFDGREGVFAGIDGNDLEPLLDEPANPGLYPDDPGPDLRALQYEAWLQK